MLTFSPADWKAAGRRAQARGHNAVRARSIARTASFQPSVVVVVARGLEARARAQLSAELTALRQQLLQQVLGGSLPPTEGASAVFDELKSNVPQDLAMLSAGLAEARRLLAA